jgi:hypothetical protein
MLNRLVRIATGAVCCAVVVISLTGCSVLSGLTKGNSPATSTAPKSITEIYQARLAMLGSTDITELGFYNGNVQVTGWVGSELKTVTQMGTIIPTTTDASFAGGSLSAEKFDVTAMNQRLVTSTTCKKDPMLTVFVAPSGAILESLACAGNMLDAEAWLDGKPLPVVSSEITQQSVTDVLTTAALTLGDKIDMIQIGTQNSYARTNKTTPQGKFTIANDLRAGGRPNLSILNPTLADGPQFSLQEVTPAAVIGAVTTALTSSHTTIDQVQLITVMIIANKPMVSVIFLNGDRDDVRLS